MGVYTAPTVENNSRGKKRKKEGDDEGGFMSLEIDINAPEPASKRALRKAKRAKATAVPEEDTLTPTDARHSRVGKLPAQATENSGRSRFGIWIGNLPFFVTKKDLQVFLTGNVDNAISSDEITRIHLPQGPPKPGSGPQNKGFAYIDFLSANAVEKALELSEELVGGRRVLIKSSKDYQGRPEPSSKVPESTKSPAKRIFVGNLEFDVSKEDLEHHFEVCGPIQNVHMATFEDTGKCKGYAWVEFELLSSAEAAVRGWLEVSDGLAKDDKENISVNANRARRLKKRIWVNKMGGRKLRMEFAEDKATRYQKRFGKESRSEGLEGEMVNSIDQRAAIGHQEGAEGGNGNLADAKMTSKKLGKVNQSRFVRSGYTTSSIQKMTGAITDGKGTKTTFE